MVVATSSANPTKTPPILLPLSFILTGVTAQVLLQFLLLYKAPMVFGEFRFNPATLAAVHLFTLGWASAIMMGALYQLLPVILLTDVPDPRAALAQGALYVTGAALLIAGFYRLNTISIMAGGTLVVVSVLLFLGLLFRAMRSSQLWSVTGTYLISALLFLLGTVSWGLTLAINFRYAFLPDIVRMAPVGAHMLLGLGGWFTLTILGVAYHLIPMFTLSHRSGDRTAHWVLGLLTAGLWLSFAGLLLGLPVSLFLVLVLAGVALFAYDLVRILRHRRRPRLDLGMRYAVTSFGYLGLGVVLAILVFSGLIPALTRSPGPAAVVYYGLFGFVSTIIMGMLYKIVPFLIWHQRFRSRNGRGSPLPTLNEMFSPRVAEAGYWAWNAGVLLTGAVLLAGAAGLVPAPGLLVQWTLPLTALGSLLFAWTLGEVLRA